MISRPRMMISIVCPIIGAQSTILVASQRITSLEREQHRFSRLSSTSQANGRAQTWGNVIGEIASPPSLLLGEIHPLTNRAVRQTNPSPGFESGSIKVGCHQPSKRASEKASQQSSASEKDTDNDEEIHALQLRLEHSLSLCGRDRPQRPRIEHNDQRRLEKGDILSDSLL